MRFLLFAPAIYLAFITAPHIHKSIEDYLIGNASVIATNPADLFNFSFIFYFVVCVILVLSSTLYLKAYKPIYRVIIPLIPILITSGVYIVYKKYEIAPIIYNEQPVNLGSLNLSYAPLLGAISGFLMIITFQYIKHKKIQNENK